jgi:hypothetical protein
VSSRPASKRHEQGRSHLASLCNYWLRRSGLSLDALAALADYGLGEKGFLLPSQISHIRNAKLHRGVPPKCLDGLAAANRAIWLWKERGTQALLSELGPFSSWGVAEDWLEGAIWLPSERHQGEPLGFGELCCIGAGWLRLSYLGQAVSPAEADDLSERLSALLGDLVGGGSPAEGLARLLAAYPIEDQARRDRLRDLLLGERWSHGQLEAELYALAITVSRLRGQDEASFPPDALHAELTAHRRRT